VMISCYKSKMRDRLNRICEGDGVNNRCRKGGGT